MNTSLIRLLSLALFAALCATLAYWGVTLSSRAAPPQAFAAPAPVRTDAAGTLFGGQLVHDPMQDLHLFGILAFSRGAAAIIGMGDAAPRAVSLGGEVAPGATLAEVRTRSVVIERHGVRTEIALPANNLPPSAIYVR